MSIKTPQLPRVSCQYGAPMGRPATLAPEAGKCRVFRVTLIEGAYDEGGAYWGHVPGAPLYAAQDPAGGLAFVRVSRGLPHVFGDRGRACAMFREVYPQIKFARGYDKPLAELKRTQAHLCAMAHKCA